MKDKLITIVKVPVGQPAQVAEIPNTLKAMQDAVDGYIETVGLFENILIVCNEDGRIRGLPRNKLGIYGDFFVTKAKGENFISLTQKQAEGLVRLFTLPERQQ